VGLSEPTGLDLTPWPNVAAWMARMRARPAWAEVHAAFYGFAASRRQLASAG
jgi:glutathione S-transferase